MKSIEQIYSETIGPILDEYALNNPDKDYFFAIGHTKEEGRRLFCMMKASRLNAECREDLDALFKKWGDKIGCKLP